MKRIIISTILSLAAAHAQKQPYGWVSETFDLGEKPWNHLTNIFATAGKMKGYDIPPGDPHGYRRMRYPETLGREGS